MYSCERELPETKSADHMRDGGPQLLMVRCMLNISSYHMPIKISHVSSFCKVSGKNNFGIEKKEASPKGCTQSLGLNSG